MYMTSSDSRAVLPRLADDKGWMAFRIPNSEFVYGATGKTYVGSPVVSSMTVA